MARLTTSELSWLEANQPKLVVAYRPDRAILQGAFQLRHQYESVILEDVYKIRLELFDDRLPRLKEVGGRLQAVLAAHPEFAGKPVHVHAYTDWTLCIATPQQLRLKYLPNPNVATLFGDYIAPYFYSQSYFEKNGRWPWDHWPHGARGVLAWFVENLDLPGAARETAHAIVGMVESDDLAARMVARSRHLNSFSPNEKCLCGSGERYMRCHPFMLKLALPIRLISQSVAQ